MSIAMTTPDLAGLVAAAAALRDWQHDRGPMQLHPGDVGFHWRDGPEDTAGALRVWTRGGRIVAVGMLDAPQLVRMAVDPDLHDDEEVVSRLLDDLTRPVRGVLGPGNAVVEARGGDRLPRALLAQGWRHDEPWTPLHRDLAQPVPDCGLRVETIGPDLAPVWAGIHWSAFRDAPMTDEDRRRAVERWRAMAASAPYAEARSLIAYDERDRAVAVAAVWSAGPGRPGLLEPIGVHAEHRGHGHGRAVSVAAAAALRELGSSSAVVCTPSARRAAVATYVSAGFTASPEVPDLRRPE